MSANKKNADCVLTVENISKRFGGLVAVDDVSVRFSKGERVGLIGPNGAGKTTFFNLLTGSLKPDTGKIAFRGQDITNQAPYKIVNIGIARAYQINNLFDGLTVLENLGVVLQKKYSDRQLLMATPSGLETEDEAKEIAEKLGLGKKINFKAGNLSHAEKRRLEIGIALATDPEVLLLDEPTAGMTPVEKNTIIDLLLSLDSDLTIILVEHDLEFVEEAVDDVIVLHQGQVLARDSPKRIYENQQVKEVYIGV